MLVLVVVQIMSNCWIEPFSVSLSKCQSCKSISSNAQYVTPQKYFSHTSLLTFAFATPTTELKLGQQIGGGLLIANHLGQSLWWPIRSTEQWLDHIYYNLSAGAQCCCTFHQQQQLVQLCWAKTIFLSQIQFYCAGSHTEHHWRCSKADRP
jgi:hypothetical protein